MKKIEKIEYPEKMHCKLITKAMEFMYGACSNMPYPDENCLEYVRADLIPQWHDANKELPQQVDDEYSDWVIATTGCDYFIALVKYRSNGTTEWLPWNCEKSSVDVDGIVAWMPMPMFNK